MQFYVLSIFSSFLFIFPIYLCFYLFGKFMVKYDVSRMLIVVNITNFFSLGLFIT